MSKQTDDKFSPVEIKQRFDAALRGARIAGHKSKEEVSRALGKVETRPTKDKKPAK